MKYMFIDLIDNCIKDVGIPIFVELNRLNKNRTILVEIQEELNSLSKEFDKDLLLNFVQKGGFIFFLDGYDEISIADRSEVTKDIQTFISKAGTRNLYILASRPEDSLPSFGTFQSFKIQPLTKKEAFELLTKYDISSKKKISKEMIKELKTGKYDAINEYLVNPLLVSLLHIAYNYKAEIPLKKHQFYRQVYDALFNSHKLAQGQKPHEKRSGLDIDDFNRVLRYVGYECLIRIGVQFDEDTILNSIKRAKAFSGNLKFGDSDFLKDLLTSVPLFVKDGIEYKWAHKSLMEYFAARFIAEDVKEDQDTILTRIYNSEDNNKYINMLDIYFDIDFKGFSKNFTLPICERYVQFYNSNYIVSNINKDLIEERIGHLFIQNFGFVIINQSKKKLMLLKRKFPDNEMVCIPFFDNGNPIFCANTKIDNLIKLLAKKNRSLFDIADITSIEKNIITLYEMIIKSFEMNYVYDIDMELGEENEELYTTINNLMSYIRPWYIKYENCKEELDRNKKVIAQSHNMPDLLEGI